MNTKKLLMLADMLDRLKPEEYDQITYGDCGTPCCALGHWARAHPANWQVLPGLLLYREGPTLEVFSMGPLRGAMHEFDIDATQYGELFGAKGCGDARNNPQMAAAFLRNYAQTNAR
jgi:hypothetical protein